MPETVKLLGSTKSNIIKDKNVENVPHLEITKAVLGHCNIINNNYQQNLSLESCLHLFLINLLVNH